MRDLIVFGMVLLALPICFRRPYIGLLVFTWLAYMRPQDLCWGFARTMRFSFYVGVTMIAGYLAYESGRRRFYRPDARTLAILGILLLNFLSLFNAKVIDESVTGGLFEFTKIVAVALFTTGQLDSRSRLRWLCWTIALSLGFFGIKGGIHGILRGGAAIHQGPGGMLEDNNDFALGMAMSLPFLWFMGGSEKSYLVRLGSKIGCLLMMVTIILTHSRGGFLSMSAVLLLIAWRSGKLLKASLGMTVAIVAFLSFAPAEVLARLDTIDDVSTGQEDGSVRGRLVSWAVALEMVKDKPILGVGHKNFQANYQDYARIVSPFAPLVTRVTHNSYLQIWSENGTFALMCFLTVLFGVFFAASRIRRVARLRPDLGWARNYANMVEASMAAFVIGGFFLNRGHFDLTYHVSAIATSIYFVVRVEAATPVLSTSSVPVPAPVTSALPTPRWERQPRIAPAGAVWANRT
jgi:probable O-glycosylation ligase (exosortase A-associated)